MNLFGKQKKPLPSSPSIFDTGKNRYRPLKLLGEGGFAQVRSFFDTSLNRVIAVKELNAASFENPDLVNAFVNDAKLVSYLDHPGIVAVFDAFASGSGKPCYAMQLVEGKTLSSLHSDPVTERPVAVPFSQALDIFMKMGETLAYAHDCGSPGSMKSF
jgi:serine/threonine protein kinase